MKKLVFIFIAFLSISTFAQSEKSFEKGKELYKAGNFQEAISTWKKIVEGGEHSANLYFNLGNANYKLNNIGESVYYYEKALQLNPNDSDIKTNLAFAENARIDAIEPLPQTVFKKWYNSISGIFTFNGWAILAIIFAFAFVALFLVYYFMASETRKRILFTLSIVSILFLVGSLAMAFTTFSDYKNNKPAIVFADKVTIKSEPNLGSNDAFVLHEGTKVQIISQDGDWFRIALTDGKDGWIPASEIKQL